MRLNMWRVEGGMRHSWSLLLREEPWKERSWEFEDAFRLGSGEGAVLTSEERRLRF
jgi:hypothetical protein